MVSRGRGFGRMAGRPQARFERWGLAYLAGLAMVFAGTAAEAESAVNAQTCALNGITLHGKVQVVDSFPDLKVQVVDSFPDLKVKAVGSFPDDCGEWQFVDSFPDFKIQYVESFPDLKIQMVESFPGVP